MAEKILPTPILPDNAAVSDVTNSHVGIQMAKNLVSIELQFWGRNLSAFGLPLAGQVLRACTARQVFCLIVLSEISAFLPKNNLEDFRDAITAHKELIFEALDRAATASITGKPSSGSSGFQILDGTLLQGLRVSADGKPASTDLFHVTNQVTYKKAELARYGTPISVAVLNLDPLARAFLNQLGFSTPVHIAAQPVKLPSAAVPVAEAPAPVAVA